MKYKAGDRVKVLSREKIEKTFIRHGNDFYSLMVDNDEIIFCDEMFYFCNKYVTIKKIINSFGPYQYIIKENNNDIIYYWHDLFFEKEPKQLELF